MSMARSTRAQKRLSQVARSRRLWGRVTMSSTAAYRNMATITPMRQRDRKKDKRGDSVRAYWMSLQCGTAMLEDGGGTDKLLSAARDGAGAATAPLRCDSGTAGVVDCGGRGDWREPAAGLD